LSNASRRLLLPGNQFHLPAITNQPLNVIIEAGTVEIHRAKFLRIRKDVVVSWKWFCHLWFPSNCTLSAPVSLTYVMHPLLHSFVKFLQRRI